MDGVGHVYVTGVTQSAGFPLANALYDQLGDDGKCVYSDNTPHHCTHVFVAKFRAGGARLLWATLLGSSHNDGVLFDGIDDAMRVALDPHGNVWVNGAVSGAGFLMTAGNDDGCL